MPSATFPFELCTMICNLVGSRNVSRRGGTVRSIGMLLLLIFPASVLLADTHSVVADGKVDFSAFKTFVVREGYPTSGQPSSGNQGTKRTPDVDSKLTQAVRDAIRSAFSSRGIKENLDSADLIVNFRIEVATHPKAVTGIVIVDLTNTATDTTIWHGQHIDNEESLARLEKRLPNAIRTMLSEKKK